MAGGADQRIATLERGLGIELAPQPLERGQPLAPLGQRPPEQGRMQPGG